MAKMRAWLSRDGLEVPYTMTNEDAGGETRALLKFIRARPKSAEKAYEMLKNTLAWRAEKGVDCSAGLRR